MGTSFKPPSKSLTPRDYLFIVAVIIAFLAFSAGLIYVNLNYINPLGGGGEFYMPWKAGRAFLFDHIDPYQGYVPQEVQKLVYDRTARPGEEPYIADIPFHMLIPYALFSLIPDPQPARVIFTLFAELALLGLVYLSLRLPDWDLPPLFALLFVLFAVLNFYAFQAVLEATPILLLGFIYAGILYALRTGQDELAGALVAISCYHWEIGGPFLILIFLHAFHARRTRVLAAFAMLSLFLLVVSFLLYPNWIIPFLRAVSNTLRADFGFSTHSILSHLWPAFGDRLAWGVTIVLLIALAYEWNIARGPDPRRFYWASCLSLAATPLLGFRTEIENLAVLVLPLAFVFAITYQRWQLGGVLAFLLLILVFAVPWVIYYFAQPAVDQFTSEALFLFLPIVTTIGVYWIRWWAIRPPRILFDRARK
ncbi:MAG: glycosyltransferase 87 family protein [Chloroflexota bacterium]